MHDQREPTVEFAFMPEGARMKPTVSHSRLIIGTIGDLAVSLVKSMCIAAKVMKETSSGEPVFELYTPQEVVTRAFEIADLTLGELAARGWSLPMPPLADLIDKTPNRPGFGVNG